MMSGILEMLAKLVMLEEGLARPRGPPILPAVPTDPSRDDWRASCDLRQSQKVHRQSVMWRDSLRPATEGRRAHWLVISPPNS